MSEIVGALSEDQDLDLEDDTWGIGSPRAPHKTDQVEGNIALGEQ